VLRDWAPKWMGSTRSVAWSLVIAAAVADGLGAAACLGFGAAAVDGGARYRPFSMFGKKAGNKHTSNVSSFTMKISNMWANRTSMNIQEKCKHRNRTLSNRIDRTKNTISWFRAHEVLRLARVATGFAATAAGIVCIFNLNHS